MRLYRKKIIALRQTISAIKMVENFTFQFNAITQSRGGGGISAMYAKLGQAATNVSDSQAFADVLKDMREKFVSRVPPLEEFKYPFATRIYRNTYTRERELVRYILRKISTHYGMGPEFDHEVMTIEHILPQSRGKETGAADDVGAIGNLIFVTEPQNDALGTKDFTKKKSILSQIKWVEESVGAAAIWGPEEIEKRGYRLAELAWDKIWKI